MGLTSIGDLAGIATSGLVAKLRQGGANLQQTLQGGSVSRTLILGEGDGSQLSGLGILDLGGDGHDLVLEPAGFLCHLRSAEGLDGILVLHPSRDVEVVADVFRGLDHGLCAIGRLLV